MAYLSGTFTTLLLLALGAQSNGLQCRSCRTTYALDHCLTTTCAYNELCYVGDTVHVLSTSYTAKCMTAKTCSHLTSMVMQYLHSSSTTTTSLFGRRSLVHMCDICCGEDLCNTKTCHELRHEFYQLYASNRLNLTSLTEMDPDMDG